MSAGGYELSGDIARSRDTKRADRSLWERVDLGRPERRSPEVNG